MDMIFPATDLEYNAPSRYIMVMIDIYLKGEILTVTGQDLLVDMTLLEETGKEATDSPLGSPSANELTFTLVNENGIFNPANSQSRFFGQMKRGVKVIPYMRTEETEPIKLGEFFVTEWTAGVTSLHASVTCLDRMSTLHTGTPAEVLLQTNLPRREAFQSFLRQAQVDAIVDPQIEGTLDWWYALPNNTETLHRLASSCHAAVYCNREGLIEVKNFRAYQELRTIVHDQNQLYHADIVSNLDKNYDGTKVIVHRHQPSDVKDLLQIKDLKPSQGIVAQAPVDFTTGTVVEIEGVASQTDLTDCYLSSYKVFPRTFHYETTRLTAEEATLSINVRGRTLDIVRETFVEEGETPLSIDSPYVQNDQHAQEVQDVFLNYLAVDLPYLDITIRGNPLLLIGERISVQSQKYNLSFIGYILRQEFRYDGTLQAQIRLLNEDVLAVKEDWEVS